MKITSLIAFGLVVGQLAVAKAENSKPENNQHTTAVADTTKAPENWFNLDLGLNGVPGISTGKAYEYLKGRPSKTVVVAVIDSGIDIKHEDLQDKIWVNEDEIAGNGIDDDKNGYIDDLHGWNFIGGKDGRNVDYDTMELTRLYAMLSKKFEGPDAAKLQRKEKEEYALYKKIKADFEKETQEAKAHFAQFQQLFNAYQGASAIIETHLGKKDFTQAEVEAINTSDPKVKQAQALLTYMAQNKLTKEAFEEGNDYFTAKLKYHLNAEYNPRDIVGDDYSNLKERHYGNNDVTGSFAEHGTHVAGIIGANRNNNLGIKGIAENVKIMVLRAVPNGDERDKDIANAIYYAVDNGAKIINMSFGKGYSPYKLAVDAAVKYAEDKGVLLVHAAGNDAKNIDKEANFPTKKINAKKEADNWIEVGASSWGSGDKFVGTFSNYGKTVDVFAPGVDIYSTIPNQQYKSNSGTSMAAPVTSGVAALLLSYFPNLNAGQVQDIILKSTVKYNGQQVNKPGEGKEKPSLVKFEELSATSGVVNAYEAVKLADSMSAGK